MILRLTNGTNTINLIDSNKKIFEWVPNAPEIRGEDVTDTGTIHFSGGTSAARDVVNNMNRLFQEAEDFNRDKVAQPVYLEFRPDGDTDVYRSLVKRGRAVWSISTFGSVDWTIGEVEINFSLTRVGYFEGPEDTIGTYNLNQDNILIELAAVDIEGDLKTPARIEVTNTNAGVVVERILAGLNRYSDPGGMAIGAYKVSTNASVSTTSTSEQLLDTVTLTKAMLDNMKGNHFHIVFNATANTENFDLQLRFIVNGNEVHRSDWIEPDSKYIFLTSLERLPPYLTGHDDIHEVDIKIYLKGRDTNTSTLTLDGIEFMPTDSWRVYESNFGVGNNITLYDIPYDFILYSDGYAGAGGIGNFIAKGDPVMLYPERLQDVLIKLDTDTAYDSSHSFDVTLKYRPRRETL